MMGKCARNETLMETSYAASENCSWEPFRETVAGNLTPKCFLKWYLSCTQYTDNNLLSVVMQTVGVS